MPHKLGAVLRTNEEFYEAYEQLVLRCKVGEIVIVAGDMNGNVRKSTNGFPGTHGGKVTGTGMKTAKGFLKVAKA